MNTNENPKIWNTLQAVAVLVAIQAALVIGAFLFFSGCSREVEAAPDVVPEGAAELAEVPTSIERLAPWKDDESEPWEERAERLESAVTVARYAVAREGQGWRGSSKMLLALVLSIGWHETRFARVAYLGECPTPGGCDQGRAWHYYQTHTPIDRRSSGILGLVDATDQAVITLRRAANYCGGEGRARLLGAVSLYATGKTCEWSGAEERVRLAERLVREL